MSHILQEWKHISHQVEKFAHQLAKEEGIEFLGGPQGRVLQYLHCHRHRDVTMTEIEKNLQSSKPVVSNLLKRMVKNGFISIEPSESDRRCKYVRLARQEEERATKIGELFRQVEEILYEGVSDEELHTFQKVLCQFKENLIKKSEENVDV